MDTKSKNVRSNIVASFVIKGLAVIVAMITLPQYMIYFGSDSILGIWYAILNVITWISMFDLGIGNGLRNKLTETITKDDAEGQRYYISSTYCFAVVFSIFASAICIFFSYLIDWNAFLNISDELIPSHVLKASFAIVLVGVCIHFATKLVTSILYALQKSALVGLLVLITNVILLLYMLVINAFEFPGGIIPISVVHIIALNVPYVIATLYVFSHGMIQARPSFKDFKLAYARDVISIGVVLLVMQVEFMLVGCSHSIIISSIISPDEVTNFNIYFKLYNGLASVFLLVLVPIWSSITKAQAEYDYPWILATIKKLWFFFFAAVAGCAVFSLVLQPVLNIWLGGNTITANPIKVVSIVVFTAVFILHNINTSVSNGLSYFKPQLVGVSVASLAFIPACLALHAAFQGWESVILASAIVLVPYEIAQPILTKRLLLRQAIEHESMLVPGRIDGS